MTAIRRMCNFKKVNITLWAECFLDSCLDISELTAFVLELQQKNLHWQKPTVRKTALIPQYCGFFFDGGFHWNGLSICAFTNTLNNSAQLKDWDLWRLVLFLLIILEMYSSAPLECAPFVCFLRKLCFSEKIRSKFVKP